MKNRIIAILLLFAMIWSLASCTNGVSVVSSSVNEEMHLIVKYSDGREEDLGYVGKEVKITITDKKVDENGHLIITYSDGTTEDFGDVTVVPPKYTVKFLDKDGNEIKSENVYKGTPATAPDAPSVPDMVFNGWDKEFSDVQGDIEVIATYKEMDSFTVTFVDDDGTVLGTDKVIVGRAATPPSEPVKDGYVFAGWNADFSNITGDITVKATYRLKGDSTVTFKDYSGRVLGKVSVKEGGNVTAPVTPTRDGYTFAGWSSSLNGITSDKTVTATYKLKGGSNILDISYTLGGNNTVTVTATMNGTVKFAALDVELTIPSGLTFKSVATNDDRSIANLDSGTIYFITANTTNITSATVLFKATFTYASAGSYTFDVKIPSICDQDKVDVSSSIIGKTITVE